jgi:hypothetical protein
MNENTALLLAALGAGSLGCDPTPPIPVGSDLSGLDGGGVLGGGGSAGGGLLVVSVDPPAPLEAAPRVLRLGATMDGFTFDPTRMALVEGTIGTQILDELKTQKVSAALTKRLVPVLTWSAGGGEVLAPEVPLAAGAIYTLVMADVPAYLPITIVATDATPLLSRLWPPQGASGTAAFAVWCGDDIVPRVDTAAVPAPGGLAGDILRGAVTAGAGERCLRFEADSGGMDGGAAPSVPPPVVAAAEDASIVVRLDPRPLEVDAAPAPLVRAACTSDEVAFGPGCGRLVDDRLYGRSAGVPLLWAVAGAGTDSVFAAASGDPFVIAGLPPSTDILLDVAAIDTGGVVSRTLFSARTLPPEPHVVINEVLAYPLGPEPAQQWVEILNDGPAPAVLDGYVLHVGSGVTPLPGGTLPPGGFALIVDEAYVAAGGPDVAPAAGTRILTVPSLGKKGLSTAGVELALLDGDGNTVSTFPAKPKPKQGGSVARLSPSAPDALPSSFALAVPTPGWTNAW